MLPVGRAGVTDYPLLAYVRNSDITYLGTPFRWHGYPGNPDDLLVPVSHRMQGVTAVYGTKPRFPRRRERSERVSSGAALLPLPSK